MHEAARLFEVNARIHGKLFRTKDVKFDDESGALEIPFERELYDDVEVTRRSLFKRQPVRWEVPVARSVVRVQNVLEWAIDDREHVGVQTLDKIRYEPERASVAVDTDVALTITARVSRLTVVVEDTEERVGTRASTEY